MPSRRCAFVHPRRGHASIIGGSVPPHLRRYHLAAIRAHCGRRRTRTGHPPAGASPAAVGCRSGVPSGERHRPVLNLTRLPRAPAPLPSPRAGAPLLGSRPDARQRLGRFRYDRGRVPGRQPDWGQAQVRRAPSGALLTLVAWTGCARPPLHAATHPAPAAECVAGPLFPVRTTANSLHRGVGCGHVFSRRGEISAHVVRSTGCGRLTRQPRSGSPRPSLSPAGASQLSIGLR